MARQLGVDHADLAAVAAVVQLHTEGAGAEVEHVVRPEQHLGAGFIAVGGEEHTPTFHPPEPEVHRFILDENV